MNRGWDEIVDGFQITAMNLIGIVATIVVAIAEPVGLNASRCRVSSRATPATDAMTNGFAAVAFVLAAIAVLIPIAHLSLRQGGNVEQFDLEIRRCLGILYVYEPRKAECKHSLVVAGRPRRWCSSGRWLCRSESFAAAARKKRKKKWKKKRKL